MKKLILFTLALQIIYSSVSAQTTFNEIHNISIQQPPYNYAAGGYFHSIFEVDQQVNFYDGYIMFGMGILKNPMFTQNYRRAFATKVNLEGELMFMQSYDDMDSTMETRFGMGGSSSLFINHKNQICGVISKFQGVYCYEKELISMDYFGTILSQIIIDIADTTAYYETGIFDSRDSTYVLGMRRTDQQYPNSIADNRAIIWKLDTLGNTIWKREFSEINSVEKIEMRDNYGFWISGYNLLPGCENSWSDSDNDRVLIVIDGNGNELDRFTENFFCGYETNHAVDVGDNRAIVIGKMNEPEISSLPRYSGYIYSTEFEFNGDELIETGERIIYRHDTIKSYVTQASIVPDNSGIAFCGFQSNPGFGQFLGLMGKINFDRELQWLRSYNYFEIENNFNNGWHYLNAFTPSSDGGFACAGYIVQAPNDPQPQLWSPWIIKLDEYGCLEPGCQLVNVEEIVIGLENTMSVFPNPVSEICTIEFDLQNSNNLQDILQKAELSIFDMQGKEVIHINLAQQLNGNQIQFSVNHLSSGIYLAHLTSEGKWLDSVKVVVE